MSDTFVISDRQSRNNVIATLVELVIRTAKGKPVKWLVTIERHTRTSAQNRLYWKWMTIIGKSIGEDKNAVHAMMQDRFLPRVRSTKLGRVTDTPASTTSLNVDEFRDYMDCVERLAAEYGIHLPAPEEMHLERRAAA